MQILEFPPAAPDGRAAVAAMIRVCRDVPAAGELLGAFRGRLRGHKLWDDDRPRANLWFFDVRGPTIVPSEFMRAVADTADEAGQIALLATRLWTLNPLLGKTVVDLVTERPHGRDEVYKILGSSAFAGELPSKPSIDAYLALAIGTGVLKAVGIAVTRGPDFATWERLAEVFDVEAFLAEPHPLPSVGATAADASKPDDAEAAPAGSLGPLASRAHAAVTESVGPESSIPVAAALPAGTSLPSALRALVDLDLPSPRGRGRTVPLSRFASGLADDVRAETSTRLAAWWPTVPAPAAPLRYAPSDFGLDAEQWVEGADEVVYRIAVAAALALRLDADRATVVRAFTALDQAGILTDLYHGTVPEVLAAGVDARALMLASLAARRCAEAPELAASIDRQTSARGVFQVLDGALGRGLFRVELPWMIDQLAQLGVVRHDDVAQVTTTPVRLVRDTLFRLGFIDSPYAATSDDVLAAAMAAHAAVPAEAAPDVVLAAFALAAGCQYDCPHRRVCEFPCRERVEG